MKDFYLISAKNLTQLILLVLFSITEFTVYAQAPTTPSSNINFSNLDGDRFYVSFNRGDGARRIIVAGESPITAVPVDGADYLAGDYGLGNEIAPGQFVVYSGTAAGIWLYGFNHSTTYFLRIFEYNGTNFTTQYLTSAYLDGTATTRFAPTLQASNLTFSNVTGHSMTVSWANGNGNGRVLVGKIGSPVNAEPQDLTNYGGGSGSFTNGSNLGNGNYVQYIGSGTSTTITGLSPEVTYHFEIFEYNGSNGKVYLRPGSTGSQITASAPTIAASNFQTSNIDGDRFYYSFTSGNGARRVVIARKNDPVTALPVNGQTYPHHTTFGSGTEISTGEYVVYDGTSSGSWIYGLDPATTYHLVVFEYNGTGTGTFYLTDIFLAGSRATLNTPTTQAGNLTFSNVTGNSMTVSWTNGNGNGRILVGKIGSPVDAEPQDLTNYGGGSGSFTNGSNLGNGNYVQYSGSGTSTTITGLSPDVTYHFEIFEYNGSNGKVYLRPGSTGSQITASAPTIAASNFQTSNIDGDRFYYSFNSGNGARRVVIARKNDPVTALPVNGQTYPHHTTFGSGTEISTGEYVVYDGTSSGSWIYGLEPATTYHLAVFEYNGTGTGTFYQTDIFLAGSRATLNTPTTQAGNLTFSNVTGNSMTVSWTNGNGNGRILVGKIGSPVDAEPQDLTNYGGGSGSFTNGSNLGNGNYVQYSGSGTSTTITGLSPNVTYHFEIFEYNGSNGKVYLRPGATGSQITASAPTLAASGFQTSNLDGDRFYYSFNSGNGARRVVIARKNDPVTALPVNGQTYPHHTTFGSGTEISTGEYVVYDGTSSGSWIYGLEPATTYHLAVFEYNGTGTGTFYQTDPYLAASRSTLAHPTVQSSNAFTSSRSNTSINISWTRGDGSHRILIGRKDGPVNVEPQDFTNYTSSSTFGNRQIGTGNYVLFAGNGNNVNVTNLEPATNYYFALFEYNGSNAKLYLRPGYQFALETFGERPTLQVSNATYSNIDFTSFNVAFTPGNGSRRLVLARAGSPVNAGPADFTSYAANSNFGTGDEVGSGNFVVYNDFGDNFQLTGLQPGTDYYFAFYEYSLSTQGELYMSPPYTSSQSTKEPYNLNLAAVSAPVSGCDLTAEETVTIEITNLSSSAVDAFTAGYSINGSVPVVEEVSGENLLPGNGSLTFYFQTKVDLSGKGTYTIEAFIVAEGDIDESNNSKAVSVGNYPEPVTGITENSTIIMGQSILLEASGGESYEWNTGETSAVIIVQPDETTEYTVTITDENGCSVVRTVTVEVVPDPCQGIVCPEGYFCYAGSCFPEPLSLSGIVRDASTNEVLAGVMVTTIYENTQTDDNGYYYIMVSTGDKVVFSKEGYSDFETGMITESNLSYDVSLPIDPCAGLNCLPGTECYQGQCIPVAYEVTGIVRDIETNALLSGVLVESTSQYFYTGDILTDENGTYSIFVEYNGVVTFTKAGYEIFTSSSVVETPTELNVYLQPVEDLCSLINCPPGTECYQGQCIPVAYEVTGVVRDAETNALLSGVSVESTSQYFYTGDILTDENGTYSIFVELNGVVTFTKAGYEIFTSSSVVETYTELNVYLQASDDPCAGLNCPPGTECYQGQCIPVAYQVTGVVRDAETNALLSGVSVESTSQYFYTGDILTDENGTYSIFVEYNGVVTFTKAGYEIFTSSPIVETPTELNVYLQPVEDLCSLINCPPGTECYQGQCIPVAYEVTGVVRDAETNALLSGVSVESTSQYFYTGDILTDENGTYSIFVEYSGVVTFTKAGYEIFTSSPIVETPTELNVYLQPVEDLCSLINCPPGTECYQGQCIPVAYEVTGVVRDAETNALLSAVSVESTSQYFYTGDILTDENGTYSIFVELNGVVTFTKAGYEIFTSSPIVETPTELNVYLQPVEDLCSLINCPPGEVCVGGQCFPVLCESSFTGLQITPETGTTETEFTFTISYADPTESPLGIGFPMLQLIAENSSAENPIADLFVTMSEVDPTDQVLADGKLYQAVVSGLSDNTSWKASVRAVNDNGCETVSAEVNAPQVSVSNLDVAIYANNISFSNETPNTNETITIFARIRNISDFPADNFVVSAYDNDVQIYTTTIQYLAPRSHVDVSWVYSFAEPGFYPIKVVIDETDVLKEINELNNFAIRPVLTGNYVLPGGIDVTAVPNTQTVYVNSWITVSGDAYYYGIDEGVNPNVAGANVTISYENGSPETTTGSGGNFSRSIRMPSVPGVYTFNVSVTDYTLTGHAEPFEVTVIPYPDKPDLVASISLDQSSILTGGTVTGMATVSNSGDVEAVNFIFRISSCEGILDEIFIASLAPGESRQFGFVTSVNHTGSCFNKNNCTFYATADAGNVVNEKTKANNTAYRSITVYPPLPDLTPSRSLVSSSSAMEQPFRFTVKVDNIGGVPAGTPFAVNVYVDDVLTDSREFSNLDNCGQVSYEVEVLFATQVDHVIRIRVDEPLGSGAVAEYNEGNNEFVRTVKYLAPNLRPNLNIRIQDLSVMPALPLPGQVFDIRAIVRNNGTASISGPVDVRFTIRIDGVESVYDTTLPDGLAAGGSELLTVFKELPSYGNHSVLVELDPDNLIAESSEFDNKAEMPLCVDFAASRSGSVWAGGFFVDTQQNLTGRVRNLGLFTATNVGVTFLLDDVEIGSAVIPELGPTYSGAGYYVSIPYTFRETGTFELKMVADRADVYTECDEDNNETSGMITVRAPQPDLRILSEYISPTELNPDLNEEINLFISFENIGTAPAQPFKVRVTVDDIPLGGDIQVNGLGAGQLSTVPVNAPYSSPTAGIKVIRGFVDVDKEADDVNYKNNEASRAIVVGQAPNLLFAGIMLSASCPQEGDVINITAYVENEGDMAANAEIHFFYIAETDTIPIDFVPVFVDIQGSATSSMSWMVVNPDYSIYAEIRNSDPVEFNNLDNSMRVEFEDTTPPVVLVRNITVYLDENGMAEITPEDVDDGSFDECGIAGMTLDYHTFNCVAAGHIAQVTLTVTDFSGNSASAAVEVFVLDALPPVISGMPEDMEVSNDPDMCGAIIEWTLPVVADNCDVYSFEQTAGPESGSLFPVGVTLVEYTATDTSGNTVSASFTVTVIDTQLPLITGMPEDFAVSNDEGQCSAIVTWDAPSAADNCGVDSLYSNWNPGDAFPVGTTVVTYTAADIHGNVQSASFDVVVTDNELPVITGMSDDIAVSNDEGQCSAIVTWDVPFADDNCEVESFTSNWEPGDAFPVGTTVVTYTAADIHGNVQSASFDVVVTDNELPVISGMPDDIAVSNDEGQCSAIVTWDAPSAADNCGVDSLYSNWNPGDAFPVGTTIVTYTAEDIHGNVQTASFEVVVTDNELPVISGMPDDIAVNNDEGQCSAIVTWDAPSAADNCGVDSLYSNWNPGDAFPVGTTIVTYTAEDIHGNVQTASFEVVVTDSELPVISGMPQNIVVGIDADSDGAIVTWEEPTATDNCGGYSLELTSGMESGSLFPVGITVVEYTATDASGNTATAGFTVTVNDTQAPQIIGLPEFIEVNNDPDACGAIVSWDEPSASHIYEVISLEQSAGPASGSFFPVGTTIVAYTAVDIYGTVATASFAVTVTDAESPVVLTRNITLQLNQGESVTISPADLDDGSWDLCGTVTLSISKDTFTDTDEGENEVVLTVTDESQNSASAIAIVTVVVNRDAACQVVAIARDLTLQLDKNGTAVLNVRNVNNGSYSTCNGKLELTVSKSVFTCEDLGDNIVILTVTDPQGYSASVPFTVTVIDLIAPVINKAPKRISVTIAPDEVYSLPDFRLLYPATDNCQVTEYEQYPEAGTLWNQPGNYAVTLKAVDASGNISQADITVVLSVSQPRGGGPGNKSAGVLNLRFGDGDEKSELNVWPNPTRGVVHIGMTEIVYSDIRIDVYSISGNLVYSLKHPPAEQISFNLSDKVSGIYMIVIHYNGLVETRKLILTD